MHHIGVALPLDAGQFSLMNQENGSRCGANGAIQAVETVVYVR